MFGKSKLISTLLVIFLCVVGGFFYFTSNNQTGLNLLDVADRSVVELEIKDQIIEVEVVNSAQSRAQGLSFRDELDTDGMLFVFPKRERHQFWMKDMKMNLDIIWITNGQVTEVTTDAPPARGEDSLAWPRYVPAQPVEWVLEVPTGFVAEHSIQPGDEVRVGEVIR